MNEEKDVIRWVKKLGAVGMGLASLGGALLAAPITLPGFLVTVSHFLVVSGTVATILSKTVLNENGGDDDPPIAPDGLIGA